MLDQLRSLAVFAKVAELGSFRSAARALSLSPSVVSHHVRELEADLGQPLLYRSTRRLSLTPGGEKLFLSARKMVEAAERGLDDATGHSESPSGSIRLTAPAFFAETRFCSFVGAFAKAHPKVEISASFTDEPRDLVRDGFDVAFRIGKLDDSTHKTKRLADMKRVLVAAPSYVAARPHAKAPRDLASWDWVRHRARPSEVVLIAGKVKRPVRVALGSRVAVDSAAAVRELVVEGVGIASLPEVLTREELARGRLVELLPRWTVPAATVHAVWPGNSQRSSLTARFIEFVAPRVAELFSPSSDAAD